jgi:putative oxidoreductase
MNMNPDPLKMQRFTGQLLSILRIVTALCFISHGTMKLFGFPAMPGEAAMGAPPLLSLMGAAGLLELVGGGLVLIGLFTRPVAFLLSGQMAIAYWMFHASSSPYPIINQGESAVLFCFIFLFISAAGPGAWALATDKPQS